MWLSGGRIWRARRILVTVVDDRLSFANPGRFPMAEKVICDDFGHAIKELKIQESDYICIVTRGHRHDADCLRMIGKGKNRRISA